MEFDRFPHLTCNMRFTSLLFLLALCQFPVLPAQNLVENPGFESRPDPVISTWPRENPPGTAVVKGWVTPTPATPDYYNSDRSLCDAFPIALAHTGQGRCALICGMEHQLPGVHNYKEYVQGQLVSTLEAGKTYNISFFVALDASSPFTASGIGAYFTAEHYYATSKERLPVTPQFISYEKITYEDGWTRISGKFKAKGGERYLTIGSFSDTALFYLSNFGKRAMTSLSSPHIRQNVYIYLDDVCVSPEASTDCGCAKTVNQETTREHYLFVLDASNSMNESGKLKLMKNAIKDFADSLDENARIAIMTFNITTQMPLTFTSPGNKKNINGAINKIKATGGTNGELAIKRVALLLDSLKIPGHVHVIMATDGLFTIGARTKQLADTSFARNNASFVVLQFGTLQNPDLVDLSRTIPESSYHLNAENQLSTILEAQVPVVPPLTPVKGDIVYYSAVEETGMQSFFDVFLKNNPDDRFSEIPRRRTED
jgi:OmpA-OmpF porin, OOP family